MGVGFEDFNFDELDDFEIDGESSGSSNDSSADAFNLSGDLGIESSNEALGLDSNTALDNKKSTKKTALITIVCGIIFIAIVFVIVGLFTGDKTEKKTHKVEQTPVAEQQMQEQVEPQQETKIVYVDKIVETTREVQTDSGWKEFTDDSGLEFDNELVDTSFTITKIKHYAKNVNLNVDGNSDCMVKTVLTGIISGYNGTYELEIPYEMGKHLNEGISFNVKVQFGHYQNGSVVVGQIKYE